MKRIVSLILILIICLSISGCYSYDETYTEIWSCIDEFDIDDFDSEEFLEGLLCKTDITFESSSVGDTCKELVEKEYWAIKGESSTVFISVCYDTKSSKEYFEIEKKFISRINTPYWSLVRINNIVFWSMDVGQSSSIMPEIMSDLGIEDSYTLKVHNERQVFRSSTRKSLDEIIQAIENKGYEIFSHDQNTENKVDVYTFVSEDGTNVYEIIACHNENSKDYVRGYMSLFYEMETEDTVTQVYYSFNDGYSMMFFGNSIETRDFWNEIR